MRGMDTPPYRTVKAETLLSLFKVRGTYVLRIASCHLARLNHSAHLAYRSKLGFLTGEQVKKLKGHSDLITAVAFSPSGKQLVSASRDRTTRLWTQRRESGQRARTTDYDPEYTLL